MILFYLTDVPVSTFGYNKIPLAEKMAENKASLMLLNGSDGDKLPPMINAQPLYETELIVEGTDAYMNNDYENHRDATFEEILHLVHDSGIGVDVENASPGVLREYQKMIRTASTNALPGNSNLWAYGKQMQSWLHELKNEGSVTQEYLASVIDSYYGLWGAYEEKEGGMWGFYIAKTREDIKNKDPKGYALLQHFFNPYLTYKAHIDEGLTGTFQMSFDPAKPYTHKSQYLLNASLTGKEDSNLFGNDQDNRIAGNGGNNIIDGKEGFDIVVYPGVENYYTIKTLDDGTITVTGDGTDTLINVEKILFDQSF